MTLKTKLLIFIITILIFQAIAILMYYIINENYFVQLFALSVFFSVIGIALRNRKQ